MKNLITYKGSFSDNDVSLFGLFCTKLFFFYSFCKLSVSVEFAAVNTSIYINCDGYGIL